MTPGEDSPLGSAADSTAQQQKAIASEPAPKRRRVALACSACRIRKSRCNGRRPKCDTCEKLGFECFYEQQETSTNLLVPKDLFAALEAKVKLLETNLENHNHRITAVEEVCGRPTGIHRDLPIPHPVPSNNVVVNIEGIHETCASQSMTDGMAISFVNEEDCGFFGPSSNIAFIRHILRALDKEKSFDYHPSSRLSASEYSLYEGGFVNSFNTLAATSSGPLANDSHNVSANLLPPDQEMQKLISAYFANTGLLFPYIYEPEFLETYRSFRESGFRTNIRRTWLGLLNMVLAMATCTSCWEDSGSEVHFEESDVYYRRAQELCQVQMLRGTTLETGKFLPGSSDISGAMKLTGLVQFLLLTGQYLQGTHKSVHTWTIHGLAVKAAMSIGLHSRDIASKFSPVQQEIRKRTWFGCILLDRSLSMTFGRPGAIPENYIHLDLPKPEPLCGSSPEEVQQLSIAFYNASIMLYRIMGRIISAFYGDNLGCEDQVPDTATMSAIMLLEHDLANWQNSLPPPLRLCILDELLQDKGTENQGRTVERFRVILTLRYLNVQLLLHRPTFIRTLGSLHKEPGMANRSTGSIDDMQANFDRAFVKVAGDIIDVIHAVLMRPNHGRHSIGAWWFTLYYAFSAALAVFGGLLISQEPRAGVSGVDRLDRARRSLSQVSEALVRLGRHNTIVLRCIKFLKQLFRLANAWDPQSPQTLATCGQQTQAQPMVTEDIDQFNLESELLSSMPTWDTSAVGFGDELELGHFFASDFQRWFERAQW